MRNSVFVCFIVYRALWWQVRRTQVHTDRSQRKQAKQLRECRWPHITRAAPRAAALRTSTRCILFASTKEKAVSKLQIGNRVNTLKKQSKTNLVISFTNDSVLIAARYEQRQTSPMSLQTLDMCLFAWMIVAAGNLSILKWLHVRVLSQRHFRVSLLLISFEPFYRFLKSTLARASDSNYYRRPRSSRVGRAAYMRQWRLAFSFT